MQLAGVEEGDDHGESFFSNLQLCLSSSNFPLGGEEGPEVGAPTLEQDGVDGQTVPIARNQH